MKSFIDRRVTICMLLVAMTLLGYFSYKQLPVELLPNTELPQLYITASSRSDLTPAYMEQQVVIPLEGAISAVGGVENMESTVSGRQGSIRVDFKRGTNLKMTTVKLQEKISSIRGDFPTDVNVNVQQANVNGISNQFMSLQVRGSGGVDRLRAIVDKDVVPRLESIDGIAGVTVYGGRVKSIEIRSNTEAMEALHISNSQISQALSQYNQERTFLGFISEPDRKYYVQLDANYDDVSQVENLVVAQGPIYLKNVATVFFDYKEETTISRVNGMDAISVSLVNSTGENLLDLSKRTLKRIDEVNREIAAQDMQLVVQSNSADQISNNISQIVKLGLMGGLLAILVLWFFLRNLSLVFFIALSIPVSILSAFNVFYAADISINTLTLLGMALAVGMLLDSSIVVLENIYRLASMGMPPRLAALQGVKEVRKALIASTLTTITVFLPFVFSDEPMIKLLGRNIGFSIISTLIFSLMVAVTFIPMATAAMMERGGGSNSVFFQKMSIHDRPLQMYSTVLKTCLRKPGPTIGSAVAILVIAFIFALSRNTGQNRQVDSDRISVNITMPTGSTLDDTDEATATLEKRLDSLKYKKDVISRIQEEQASITVTLQEGYNKKGGPTISQLVEQLSDELTLENEIDVRVTPGYARYNQNASGLNSITRFMSVLGVGDNTERIVVKGSDTETMRVVSNNLRYYLEQLEFVRDVRVDNPGGRREVQLTFDPVAMASYNITNQAITSALNSMNRSTSTGASFKVGTDEYDIVIMEDLTEEEEEMRAWEKTLDDLRRVTVTDANGGTHELQQIANIRLSRGPSEVRRVNRDRRVNVTYAISQSEDLPKDVLDGYHDQIDDLIANYNLPSGLALEVQRGDDSTSEFKFLILASIILIFMILASAFESLTTPIVLLFSIPLAAIGSLLALLLSGNSLMNANTLTGFLILLGIVVNNGIILIDYSSTLRRRGYNRMRSIMNSGYSRLRPICITTITTIVTLIPMAMGDNEYAGAIGAPFALTVIGGLTFSAVLTLLLIPTLYISFENMRAWYKGLGRYTHIMHAVLFGVGLIAIFSSVHGIFRILIYIIVLAIAVPGVTYFIKSSVRIARKDIVKPDEPIVIEVRNLVKVYDWYSLFLRQWRSGLNIRRRLGLARTYHHLKDFIGLLWQVVVFGFTGYLAGWYFEKQGWILLMTIITLAGINNIIKAVLEYVAYKNKKGERKVLITRKVLYWALPVCAMIFLSTRIESTGFMVFIAVVWLLGLIIRKTSDYLYENNINVERLEGETASLRRAWFLFVKSIPIIGKRKKPFRALRGVSFEIHSGMFGLLGPNGAGKSTFMRIVTGILRQSYGTVFINGMDTLKYREELQSLIGFLPQEFGMYESMSAWDFLDYQAILKGIHDEKVRKERLEYVLTAVHMYEQRNSEIGSFSGGMKQRIGIALILLNLPRILVVDEPTAGLDPRERIRFRNLLVELSRDRIVIFSTHIIEDIASSCNQVVVIEKGNLKYFGLPSEMVNLAKDKVWLFDIEASRLGELDEKLIANHMQDGNMIKVRYISPTCPWPGAEQAEPNLEDAYLCLLKNL
ncbi:MAG: efflux RND transporter permease subunit [Bacteroidaceae bacterium]|nr:efflux RND transporter permease subunit [Bacteroidaceae bacterium]